MAACEKPARERNSPSQSECEGSTLERKISRCRFIYTTTNYRSSGALAHVREGCIMMVDHRSALDVELSSSDLPFASMALSTTPGPLRIGNPRFGSTARQHNSGCAHNDDGCQIGIALLVYDDTTRRAPFSPYDIHDALDNSQCEILPSLGHANFYKTLDNAYCLLLDP
ncbi:uncharacterized protein LACBIDRAFT_329950 [Laccaria bicolor S238N-H82]|uniref:Predicted protein n=1 Tax=Laccaria bicolor (strain S238N-H82 / ATCC MYA-4686) TaxID=486041 RepID=B0DJQ5_LACBS|nr:uncharacterized protein LACBIDRAFT_329950 [Laccaria bicolor S238N-H82]EDR05250.1 predicted protein [Laccaria bicolor S238N-H82]|eukprot:XP_001884215.1 predicted protein [Laccaria bicolor S238N-H82]